MMWQPPELKATRIVVTQPVVVADPAAHANQWLDDDAIALVECWSEVKIVLLRDLIFDERTAYVHAFSERSRTDFRAVRRPDGWLVDAVREDDRAEGSRPVFRRAGRHLCLGKATANSAGGTLMREARIRPYSLPIDLPENANAFVDFADYYSEDDTGDLHCIAHRVIAIRKLSHE